MNRPDDARIWIFGISPSLDEARGAQLRAQIDRFVGTWAAHGEPITADRDLIEGTFLVIGVDRRSETSGCSIDRMFGLLQELERQLGLNEDVLRALLIRLDKQALEAEKVAASAPPPAPTPTPGA